MNSIFIDGFYYYAVPSLREWQANYWIVITDRNGGSLYVREDKIIKPKTKENNEQV